MFKFVPPSRAVPADKEAEPSLAELMAALKAYARRYNAAVNAGSSYVVANREAMKAAIVAARLAEPGAQRATAPKEPESESNNG